MSRQTAIRLMKALTMLGIYGGLLMPLMFIPYVIFPFVFSKLIYFQVLVGLTFPAYLLLAWMDPQYRPKLHHLYTAIAAYMVAIALSVAFAVDPMRAWWGNQERMNGLFTILHFFAWFTMTVGVLKTWDQWKRLLNYEVVLSGFMATVALIQKKVPDLLMFTAGPRVGGLLDNPIYMAAYQIFNLSFLLLLSFRTRSWHLRAWYGLIALLDIGAFMAAESRGALVGLAAGVVMFALFFGWFAQSKKLRWTIVSAAVAFFALYGLGFAFRQSPLIANSFFSRFYDFSGSVTTRLIAWDIAWKGFLERPLTGWGFDCFHILFNLKYNPQSLRFGSYETWFDRSHNTVLDVLSMTGLIGFITYAGVFAMLFYSVWRAFRKGWIDLPLASVLVALPVAYFVQNLFVFDHPAGFSMSYLLFAFVVAATTQGFAENEPEPASAKATSHELPSISAAILYVLAGVLVWRTSVIPFEASKYSLMANAAFGTPQGLEWALQANRVWTPYVDEQAFLVSRNFLNFAVSGTLSKLYKPDDWFALSQKLNGQELEDHPRNTHSIFIYARLLQEMARTKPELVPQVEQLYFKAIDTSPYRQQLHYGLASLYFRYGKVTEGLQVYKRVADFDPELGETTWTYGIALMYDAGNTDPKYKAEGAPMVLKSVALPFPYAFKDQKEYAAIIEASQIVKTPEAYDTAVKALSRVPNADASFYANAAYTYLRLGNADMASRVVAAGQAAFPGTQAAYDKIQADAAAPAAVAPPVTTSTPEAAVATATGSYKGMRK
jgi:O-antigen ligase/tetratricopeptide (TPR) repeat protein